MKITSDLIDKAGPIPLHTQVKQLLLDLIREQAVLPGQKLPSERTLAEQLAVSRITVRQAFSALVQSGHIESRLHKGYFVLEQEPSVMNPLVSFSQQMADLGRTLSSEILQFKKSRALRTLSQFLDIPVNDEIVLLERLRYVEDRPYTLQTTYLPDKLVPGIRQYDFTEQSLYVVLREKYGLALSDAIVSFETRLANEEERVALQLADPSPLLIMRQITLDADGAPIEFSRSLYRPHVTLETRFGATISDFRE